MVLRQRVARLHRQLGVLLLPVIGLWFLSGFGMLFFRYPQLEEAARLRRSPSIVDTDLPVWRTDCVPQRVVGDALGRARVICVDAASDSEWSTESYAALAASAFLQAPRGTVSTVEVLHQADLWTLPQRYEFPLTRVQFATPGGDVLYVSHRTGQVVQWTTRAARWRAWLGPIPHWVYIPALRRHREVWRYLVVALALLGTCLGVTGLMTGVSRLRRDARGRWTSVFTKRPYRLHQFSGIAGGILVVTWSFSGALSLNPLNWSSGSTPTGSELVAWSATTPVEREALQNAVDTCSSTGLEPLKEVVIRGVAGRPFVSCGYADGAAVIVELRPPYVLHPRVPSDWVLRAASKLGRVRSMQTMDADAYHYSRRGESPSGRVYRVETERLTIYADEKTGLLRSRFDASAKLERWLYHGLHSLDFALLYSHRTWWLSVMVVALLLGGLVVFTGGFILARRVRRSAERAGTRRR